MEINEILNIGVNRFDHETLNMVSQAAIESLLKSDGWHQMPENKKIWRKDYDARSFTGQQIRIPIRAEYTPNGFILGGYDGEVQDFIDTFSRKTGMSKLAIMVYLLERRKFKRLRCASFFVMGLCKDSFESEATDQVISWTEEKLKPYGYNDRDFVNLGIANAVEHSENYSLKISSQAEYQFNFFWKEVELD